MRARKGPLIKTSGTPGRIDKGALPPHAIGATTGSSPGTGSVQAADGTTIEWSTAADGTVTAVGTGGARMVIAKHGLAKAAEGAVAVGSGGGQITPAKSATTAGEDRGGAVPKHGRSKAAESTVAEGARGALDPAVASAATTGVWSRGTVGPITPAEPPAGISRSLTEFSVEGRGAYLTIGTMMDESRQFVSFEVVSEQTKIELDVAVTGSKTTASARFSGKSGSSPVSWSGEVDLASPPAAIPGWPSNVFGAQMIEASYFAPACRVLALSTGPSASARTQPKNVALDEHDTFGKAVAWGLGSAAGLAVGALLTPGAVVSGVAVIAVGLIGAATSVADSEDLFDSVIPDIQQLVQDETKNLVPPEPDVPDDPLDEGCFATGTVVSLGNGEHQVIERIAVGDLVASRDEFSGQSEEGLVTRTWAHHGKQTIDLTLEAGERIRTTSAHRIFTMERGIVTAGELSVGDHVKTLAGISQPIVDITPGPTDVTVHNLTVDRFHTYFVGEAGVWVHNDKGEPDPDEPDPDEPNTPDGSGGPNGGPSPEPA